MRLIILGFVFALSNFTSAAYAAGFNQGVKNAVLETKATVDDFTQLHIKERLRKVIGKIVQQGAKALAEKGNSAQANQLMNEWLAIESKIFNPNYLGQHQPLSQYLTRTSNTLELILGKSRMQQLHLDDLFVINYAIPVVLDPNGGWGRHEYGVHFVPLASVVTFWSSFGACMYAFGGRNAALPYCDKVGVVLKRGMNSDIGPLLSNFVFDKLSVRNYNGKLNITAEQIARRYSAELSRIEF